jgi:4-methyl-5(b-hydroxyethyl)-thiazole monophosphate biosynthesis
MSRACVLLADGFEEIEAVTIIDVLRRAGVDTRVLGVGARDVTGAHRLTVRADALLADAGEEPYDVVVLPGGIPGATNLRDSDAVQRLIKRQHARGGRLAAICAAPIALSRAGVLVDRRVTSYPGFEDEIQCAAYEEAPVVVDRGVITSRGPGTALEFALRLVAELGRPDTAEKLREGMLVRA